MKGWLEPRPSALLHALAAHVYLLPPAISPPCKPWVGDAESVAPQDKKTVQACKEKCVKETEGKCNFISRYQQSNKNDESLLHCRFYTCPDPSNVNYVDQTSWGNGAGQSYLLKIMRVFFLF